MDDKFGPNHPSQVVCVGILFHNGRVLIGLRPPGVRLGGLWEFPGGKLQPPESPEACLMREMREETGLQVGISKALDPIHHRDPDLAVELRPFLCHLLEAGASDKVQARGSALRWVTPAELADYDFPPANAPLLRSLATLLA